jgi:hypothetical protein
MTVGDALTVVDILQRRLIGSDVTLSAADYHTWWKRGALDHQKAVGVPDVRRAKDNTPRSIAGCARS